jgi:hypothetical protein
MCDPVGIIGLALSVGMQAMQYQAQQDMYNKQNSANEQWLAYQRMKARQENQRQESMRQRAEAARKEALEQLTPEEQIKAQQEEEARNLADRMPAPSPAGDAGSQLLGAGQQAGGVAQGGGSMLQNDLAAKIAEASKQARARIAALAGVDAYGGNSQFGLANRANDILGTSASDIAFQANLRRGSLVAYGAEKQVEPLKYQMGGGSQSFSGLGSAIGGIAGKSLGSAMAGPIV